MRHRCLAVAFLSCPVSFGFFGAGCLGGAAEPTSGASSPTSGDSGTTTAAPKADAGGAAAASIGGGLAPYQVMGPTVVDSKGAAHLFRGVARPSLEWNASGENFNLSDYTTMKAWGANVVRLSLNQDFWIADPTNTHAIGYYPSYVDQQVQQAESSGLDVILDLHRSDGGSFSLSPGQWCMADQNSIVFWTQVATKYKNDPHVLFELYNEPYVTDPGVWMSGGQTTCNSSQTNNGQRMTFSSTFMAAGMQTLYDTVRATGAQNLVIVGGINYAFDLSPVGRGYRVKDASGNPAPNVIYNTHPYNESGKTTPAQWDTAFGYLAATDPVIATEFGDGSSTCGTGAFDTSLIAYFDTSGASNNPAQRISWTAWAFYPGGCSFPSLLQDWTYATTPAGGVVQSALTAFHQ